MAINAEVVFFKLKTLCDLVVLLHRVADGNLENWGKWWAGVG